MRQVFRLSGLALAGLLLLSACAGIARLTPAPGEDQEAALQGLVDRWQDYRIFATVWRGDQVKAIIFDPKADDRKILAERWVQVQSKEELSRLMRQIRSGQTPRLFDILGPQERLFGHIYTPIAGIQAQILDNQSIRVYEIKPPNAPAA